jgi:hypothetical protein
VFVEMSSGAEPSPDMSFVDGSGAASGWYRLRMQLIQGPVVYSPVVEAHGRETRQRPRSFDPIVSEDGQVNFRLDLATAVKARIQIFNARGQLVRTLADESLPAGRQERRWDRRDAQGDLVQRGVYFARVELGTELGTYKVVLSR